jgi:hypothetical protein
VDHSPHEFDDTGPGNSRDFHPPFISSDHPGRFTSIWGCDSAGFHLAGYVLFQEKKYLWVALEYVYLFMHLGSIDHIALIISFC